MQTIRMTLALLVLAAAPAAPAATITLDFGELPNTYCGTSWDMSGLPIEMTEWTTGGCIAYHTSSGWLVAGGSLLLDLATLDGLESVTVEYYDYYAGGGTSLYLLNGDTPEAWRDGSVDREDTSLTLDASGLDVTHARLLVRNALIYRMTFDFGALPAGEPTWGALKSLYR